MITEIVLWGLGFGSRGRESWIWCPQVQAGPISEELMVMT